MITISVGKHVVTPRQFNGSSGRTDDAQTANPVYSKSINSFSDVLNQVGLAKYLSLIL